MSSVWVVWSYGLGVEGVFSTAVEANAAAMIVSDGVVEECQVTELVAWCAQRQGVTVTSAPAPAPVVASVADPEELSPEELERLEQERDAAWRARDRANDPEPSADLSNVHRDAPGCTCLGCQATGASWLRVTT